jgi:membrane-associated phospholipid phosphatase
MNRSTQWLSLIAGFFLLLYGLSRLYFGGEWVLSVIAVLIIAFTLSSMAKNKQKE